MARKTGAATSEAEKLAKVRSRVSLEARRFRKSLRDLVPRYPDKWVVFRDGKVVSVHDSAEQAYVAGVKLFGPYGGNIIALVADSVAKRVDSKRGR
jgi:hypothetical protein